MVFSINILDCILQTFEVALQFSDGSVGDVVCISDVLIQCILINTTRQFLKVFPNIAYLITELLCSILELSKCCIIIQNRLQILFDVLDVLFNQFISGFEVSNMSLQSVDVDLDTINGTLQSIDSCRVSLTIDCCPEFSIFNNETIVTSIKRVTSFLAL